MKKEIFGAAALALVVGIAGCKSVVVNSTPVGANARFDGKSDTTPTTVEVNIFKSKKVAVSKSGYASKTVNVTFDSPNNVHVNLDREFNVKSNPTGANIYVNGDMVGKTPAKEVAINDTGASVLEVRKKGWLPAKMTIKPDTPVDVTLTMEQDGSGRRILTFETFSGKESAAKNLFL